MTIRYGPDERARIAEIAHRRVELGVTYEAVSRISGIPIGTVHRTLGGHTEGTRDARIVDKLHRAVNAAAKEKKP